MVIFCAEEGRFISSPALHTSGHFLKVPRSPGESPRFMRGRRLVPLERSRWPPTLPDLMPFGAV